MQRNVCLEQMNLGALQGEPGRNLECLVTGGLSLHNGAQLALDATLVSPLTATGRPRLGSHRKNGAAHQQAKKDKVRRYPEFQSASRCRLVVAGMEVGGRWSTEAAEFLEQLAWQRVRDTPERLRRATALALERRWAELVSVSAMKALADTLLYNTAQTTTVGDDGVPRVGELLDGVRYSVGPEASRLGL